MINTHKVNYWNFLFITRPINRFNRQTFIVDLRPIGTAEHLKHVWYWVVFISMYLAIVVLRVHDDNKMRWQTKTPGQTARHYNHLDVTAGKQVLDESTFQFCEPLVQVCHAITYCLTQSLQRSHQQTTVHLTVKCKHISTLQPDASY